MTSHRRPLLETLEERILYSADPGPVGLAAAVVDASQGLQDPTPTETQGTELVFLDSRSPDRQMLLDDFAAQQAAGRQLEVVMVDASEDGIGRIGRSLQGRSDVSTIHIVGHGEAGSAQLGASRLDSQTLLQRAGEIAAWSDALTADADLLLYGCDVGAGAAGQDLINGLAELTGADVAASDDPTGSTKLGGDWQLEVQRGQIEAASLTSDALQARWSGLLNTYTVTNTADSGAGSLRQAILDANANSGADSINFAISGTQVHTITLASVLPDITDTVSIDATTDDSFTANSGRPAVVINGNGLVDEGLTLADSADGSVIRGLVINKYTYSAIYIQAGSDGNTIVGNYLGDLDASGNQIAGVASSFAVLVEGANNRIGGSTAADRNVIASATTNEYSLVIRGVSGNGNTVSGNYFGTDASGTIAFSNPTTSVSITSGASGNTIGGPGVGAGNVIGAADGLPIYVFSAGSGNVIQGNRIGVSASGTPWSGSYYGILVSSASASILDNWIAGRLSAIRLNASSGSVVQGNRIGTDLSGTANWGPSQCGVVIDGSNNLIGGTGAGQGNIIANSNQSGSAYDGIEVRSGTGNVMLGNSIYGTKSANGALGIDLAANGVNANDAGDTDTGANNLQNFPVLTEVRTDGVGQVFVVGGLNTNAGSNYYRIEFFASPTGNASGNGEGQTYLGFVNVPTTGSIGSFSTTLSAVVPTGYAISATATKSDAAYAVFSDTSEFSANMLAQAVNTAPTITQGATTGLGAAYSEDSPTVGLPVDGAVDIVGWVDPDPGAVRGMALVSTSGNGTWQYSTDLVTWHNVRSVSDSNALLLSSTSWLRYIGDGRNEEQPTIQFRAWDMSSGSASTNSTPSYVTPGVGGGSSAFSTQTANAFTVILGVNDAPVLTPVSPALSGITEDQTSNGGQTVASILGSSVSDVDNGALEGVAVVTTTNGNGLWEYSINGGTSWSAVGAVSNGSALLLRAEDKIRFVPDGKNGTTASITYRAWDQSSGSAGSKVDASTQGGTSAFSSATDTASLIVTSANDVSLITSSNTASVAENTTAVLTVTATDADLPAQTLSYSIIGGADAAKFQIDANTGALSFITAPDFEAPTDVGGDNLYEVTVQVSDGVGGTVSQAITVTVTPTNDNTPVITSSATASVSENTTAVLTVTATDADLPAQTLSYSIIGGADASKFQIDANTGALSFIAAPDFEAPTDVGGNNIYNVTVQVSDGAGGTTSQAITVTVTPGNDSVPVITSSATASISENTMAVLTVTATDADLPAQTLSYSIIGGADASKFQIDANTGALSFIAAPDFEAPTDVGGNNLYEVTVQVSDGAGGTTSQVVTVTVTPANDNTPVITSSATASISENTMAVLTVTATDADLPAQTLSYSIIGGADASKFQIDANTGALSFIAAPDFEAPTDVGGNNLYEVTVQVSDGAGGTTSQVVTVTVTPANDNTPVITSSATASGAENTTAVLTVTATDADLPAQTLSYSIIGGADAAKFQIDPNTGALSFIAAPDFEAPTDAGGDNIYNVTVQVSDGAGGTASQAITVTVTPTNDNTPAITSSATASVPENTTAVLTVTATDADLPAQPLNYSIIGGADAAKFQIDPNTGALSFITAPDFEAPTDVGGDNLYEVTVQVSDGAGGTTSQAITVTVTPTNDNTPVITSSATASVSENTTAVLTVTAADADLPSQTLSYSIIGGADAAKFQIDANTGALSFVAAPDFEAPTDAGGDNLYNVTVQVSDGAGGTASQAITVTVTPTNDNTPAITSSATASVPENTTAVLTVTATDADLPAQTLSYSIIGGADASKFQIDANTGALSFIAAPDFEAPTDVGGDNIYNVTVQVSDGAGGTASQAITVTVTPINDNTPLITSSATASVAENTTAVLTVTATDADLPAQTLSYSIIGGADASKFQIDPNTGALSFIAAPDFEAPTDVGGDNLYNVTVQVSDGSGGTASQAIAVTVTPANDNTPAITSSNTASISENTTAVLTVTAADADLPTQTLIYSIIGGADAAKFQIDPNTGALSFIAAPDFEAPTDVGGNNIYNVTVQVSDGSGGTTSQAIAVTVTPTNDNTPVITSSATASISENTTAVLTVTATDADLPAQTLSYSIIGGADASKFQIDANTGALSFITAPDFEAPTDVGGDNLYEVTVQVSDGAGGTTSQAIAVTVTPTNDNTPLITSSATASVAENTTAVLTVTATDADLPAQTLSYSIIGGADAAKFQIDPNTGALSFITAPDFEAPTDLGGDNLYNVTVQVSDGSGGTASQAIAVTVTPANDNTPAITSSNTASISENTTAVLTVTATDADLPAQTLSYSIIGGADASKFQIDANTGALSFIAAPDFEAPTDVGGNNIYNVTVQVSDGAGGTTSQAITVTVTPGNDSVPVITSSATASISENTMAVLTVTATDADLPAQTLTYSIIGGADASKFQIDPNTGALSFITAPDFEVPTDAGGDNLYNVTVQVSDGAGGTTSQAITVTVTPINDNTPVITSSATASVSENSTTVLTVIATDSDLPSQTLSYSIIGGADASKFQIDANTGALSFISAPDFEAPTDAGGDNLYNVTVQVSDGAGGTTSQAITVTVTPGNDSVPVITSSATASVAENTTAVLTVTATDADLPSQTLSYSIIGGADAAKFQIDPNTGALSFIAAPDFEAPTDAGGDNIYDVTVQVSDGAGGTTSQAISITVTDVNENSNAPVITSSSTASIPENTTAVLTVTATDADLPAQTLTYSIIGGADASKFQIDPNTGALSFIAAPDFEAPTDAGGDNIYNVTVQVSDGAGGTASQAITVTVTPTNDNTPVITSSATASISENTSAVLTVIATDADLPSQTLSYSIIGGADASKFQIDANTGALSFIAAPDFEAPTDVGGDNIYNVTVQVSDGAGGTASQAITVTVTPINDNTPLITSSATASVAENTTAVLTVTATDADLPAQTLSYSIIGGADASKFQIDANTGALSFIAAPDFEAPTDVGGNNLYNVTVQVSDGAGGTTSQAITVTVTPGNDSVPVITSSATASIPENTTAVLTVTATDADLPTQPLSYSIIGGADAAKFQIDPNTGALSFITAPDFEAPTDAGGDNLYNVTVQVSDGAGGTVTLGLLITVIDVKEDLPPVNGGPSNGNTPGSNGAGPPVVGEGALPQLPQPAPQPPQGDKVPPQAKPRPEGGAEDALSARPAESTGAKEGEGNPVQPAETPARRQFETRTGLYVERAPVVLTVGSVLSEALMEFLLSGEMSDGSGAEGRAAHAVIVAGRIPPVLDEGGGEETLRPLELVGVASLVLSAGTIWWAVRASGLVASLLMAAPAWITFDPLPVLGPQDEDEPDWSTEEGTGDAPDEENVDEMFVNVDDRGAWQ